ncbi:MAG: YtxH domain-containing protein [Candidatus Magnetoovum sp. WYHC-5]|nr:YtxH domain-containing protein [Candidatus Magnetoovum sp. WYHC-5]
MATDDNGRKMKRYVLLGSFIGGLVGATLALFIMPQTMEERKRKINEIQRELFSPVKSKFLEIVEHLGESLIRALDEAAQKALAAKDASSSDDSSDFK